MVQTLKDMVAAQNHRCDECLHAEVPSVPTMMIIHERNAHDMLRVRRFMLLPQQHAFCPILQARVRTSGGCDEYKRI